jgi:DNA-binding transcriptional LysR family regulator
MDLDLLNTFIEVSKTRHFGKAADNLFITQSAVSARVRLLERELNSQLFERSSKQVSLTEEGEKFALHAETILLAWTNAKIDLSTHQEHDESLSIGSTSGLWHYVFNNQLGKLIQQQSLMISALTYSQEELTRLLYSGALDVVFVYEPIAESGFDSHLLGTLNLNLVMHAECSERYINGETPYVHVDWGSSFNMFVSKQFGEALPMAMQTDSAQTAQAVLLSLNACTYLPENASTAEAALIQVDKRRSSVFKRRVYACFSLESNKKKVIKALVKQLSF